MSIWHAIICQSAFARNLLDLCHERDRNARDLGFAGRHNDIVLPSSFNGKRET